MASSVAVKPKKRAAVANGGWWGQGPPPDTRWPGVTIRVDDGGGRFRFDAAQADRVCQWFPRYCSHSKGVFAGQAFELLDYQVQLILRPLFGWVREDGTRRFRKAYIQIPKKNGKTQLIAGLALYMLLADREPGAEVYVAAADRDQARILFNAAKAMVEANPKLKARLTVLRNSIIRNDDPTAFFQVLSAEAATKHGPNIHCLIMDELHAQPDRDLFETLTRGVIARRQPLILLITTAGDDDESICYEEYDYAKRVMSGTIQDDQHLPVIFEARPDDDWLDPALWRRVNPAFGKTVDESSFAAFAREAENEPRKRNDFLRFHLNRWVNQATAWIPVDWWDACPEDLPPDDILRTYPCAVGVDLSQKYDLTAVVAVFRLPLEKAHGDQSISVVVDKTENGDLVTKNISTNYRIALVPMFFLPEDTLRERVEQDGVRYDLWTPTYLRKTEGTMIDYDAVFDYITKELPERFPLVKQAQIGYDPAFATDLKNQLEKVNFKAVEVRQNYSLSPTNQVLETLIKAKRVIRGKSPILRLHVENVQVKTDDAGRIKMVKPKKVAKRIDGLSATAIGLDRLIAEPDLPAPSEPPSVSVISW